jgi:hypothetical protein
MTKRYHKERDRHMQRIESQRVVGNRNRRREAKVAQMKGTSVYRETSRINFHSGKGSRGREHREIK